MRTISIFKTAVVSCLIVGAASWAPAATRTWQVASGNWGDTVNWSGGAVPGVGDDAVIDGSVTANAEINAVPTTTIDRLIVKNNATTTLTATGAVTVTLGGVTNVLQVSSGSTLILSNPPTVSATIIVNIASGSTASIDGDIVSAPTVAANPHRVVSNVADALQFNSGSSFAMAPTTTGAGGGFGASPTAANSSSIANGIRFKAGSTFYQGGYKDGRRPGGTGSNPFSLTAPASMVVFDSGSTYVNLGGLPASSGRTYANFVWADGYGAARTFGGGTLCTILNDFTIAKPTGLLYSGVALAPGTISSSQTPFTINGNFTIQQGGAPFTDAAAPAALSAFTVKGNVSIAQPNLFVPSANANRVYVLEGTSNQNVNFAQKSLSNLTVTNPAGVTLTSGVAVQGSLTMNGGNIVTGSNLLEVGSGVTTVGAIIRNSGNVVGNLKRWVAAGTGATGFPIGGASDAYDTTVTFTAAPSAGGSLTAFFTAGAPGNTGLPLSDLDLRQITGTQTNGFWTVSAGDGLTGGTYDLALLATGFSNPGSDAFLRIVKRATAGPWTVDGAPGTNAFPLIARTGLSGFSEFAVSQLTLSAVSEWNQF